MISTPLKPITVILDKLKSRIAASQKEKNTNWVNWAAHLLKRTNILIDTSICAYGKTHIVDRVRPYGGGSVFWSKACDGCHIGAAIVRYHKAGKEMPNDTGAFCALLKTGLLTRDSVKPGDVYTLPSIGE